MQVSDWASTYANAASSKMGAERFWPRSNDTLEEIAKCERILRTFTVEGIAAKEEKVDEIVDAKGNRIKKKRKVLKKIPPRAIRNAKGIVIYTAMRSGIAPLGGAGGTGLMMARLPDGSWSAPTSVSPNNFAVGLLLGFDVFNVVLLLNSQKTVDAFGGFAKVTFGAETAVAAGPLGAGISMESGVERAPIYSYVQSRGLYAGVELMGQAFLSRFDENERFYYWPGIKAADILTGKVRIPPSVAPLHRALRDAETGAAQGEHLERTVYDVAKIPPNEALQRLSRNREARHTESSSSNGFAAASSGKGALDAGGAAGGDHGTGDGRDGAAERHEGLRDDDDDDDVVINDGERLKLPPTPAELEALEAEGIPDEEDLRLERLEREQVYKLPPPPLHNRVKTYWDQHPTKAKMRPTQQLTMGFRAIDDPANIPLPPSPWEVPLPPSPWETALPPSPVPDAADAFVPLPPPIRRPPPQDLRSEHREQQSSQGNEEASVDTSGQGLPRAAVRRLPPPLIVPANPTAESIAVEDEATAATGVTDADEGLDDDAEGVTFGRGLDSAAASAAMRRAFADSEEAGSAAQDPAEPLVQGNQDTAAQVDSPAAEAHRGESPAPSMQIGNDIGGETLSRSSSVRSAALVPPPRRPPRSARPIPPAATEPSERAAAVDDAPA
ncbi:unnamed protein product [Parajaminaea phylloscopi]